MVWRSYKARPPARPEMTAWAIRRFWNCECFNLPRSSLIHISCVGMRSYGQWSYVHNILAECLDLTEATHDMSAQIATHASVPGLHVLIDVLLQPSMTADRWKS